MQHELKTQPEFFQAVLDGTKRFELRRNDRDFRVGDELLLLEYNPSPHGCDPYTGRKTKVRVTFILDCYVGLAQTYVCLSITPAEED